MLQFSPTHYEKIVFFQLYCSRVKCAEGADLQSIKQLSFNYVSDEEDGEGENRGKWVVRAPLWRSVEAADLMKRLQEKVDAVSGDRPKMSRIERCPSSRKRPRESVEWARKQDRRYVSIKDENPFLACNSKISGSITVIWNSVRHELV